MADPLTKACYPCSIDVHGDCRRHEGEPCGCQVGEFCGVKVRVFIASEPRPVADPLADVIRQALAGGASGSSVTPADLAAAAVRAHLAAEPPSETLRLVLEQQAANVRAFDGIVTALQQDHAATQAELAAERARADRMAHLLWEAAWPSAEGEAAAEALVAEHVAAREAAR